MSDDARFEDAIFSDRPLRLAVEGTDDLEIVSALVQDAVGTTGEISWMPRRRRLVLLVNRFRWEDGAAATRAGRAYERVRSALIIDQVQKVRSNGLDPADPETVYSILTMAFEAGDEPSGTLTLELAGDGALALSVEAIDLRLEDLTRPWQARAMPDHKLD